MLTSRDENIDFWFVTRHNFNNNTRGFRCPIGSYFSFVLILTTNIILLFWTMEVWYVIVRNRIWGAREQVLCIVRSVSSCTKHLVAIGSLEIVLNSPCLLQSFLTVSFLRSEKKMQEIVNFTTFPYIFRKVLFCLYTCLPPIVFLI